MTDGLMDYKTDIILNVSKFMQELREEQENVNLRMITRTRNRNKIHMTGASTNP